MKKYVTLALVDVARSLGASRTATEPTDAPTAVTCVAVAASSAGVNVSGTSISYPTTSPIVTATLRGTETISIGTVVASVATVLSGARIAAETTTVWSASPATKSNVASRVAAS